MSEITLTIKCSNSSTANVTADPTETVLQLKERVATVLSVPAAQQRLIYKGRVLKDELTLDSYSVENGHTVHMVKGAAAAASAASASPAPATPAAPSSSSAPSPTIASPPAGAIPNPFAMGGLGGLGALGGLGGAAAGNGDINRMTQQLMNSPEMMQQIMNSPMMEAMMNNPDMMRNMMLNNPQMQAMLDANPQVRHILNDPAIMRQTMEMMRNPNAMREAMRHQDLAMSQLENIPGGFNAMRRMFEDVHEPMMDAMNNTATGNTGSTNAPANPPSTAPTNSAMPNPWGAPAANTGLGAAANPFAGLGGMGGFGGMDMSGLGGMGGMGGMGADPAMMSAMMQNPAMQQMMQQMLSDPAMIQQMSAMNPQLGAALQNPQMRAMLTNPEFLRRMSDPATMQAMQQMQQSMQTLQGAGLFPMLGAPGGFGGAGFGSPYGGGAGAGGNALNFDQLFGGMGGGFAAPAAAAPVQDPAVRFASQLQQLQDMGFGDQAANLRALQASHGNVNAAVERLLNGI